MSNWQGVDQRPLEFPILLMSNTLFGSSLNVVYTPPIDGSLILLEGIDVCFSNGTPTSPTLVKVNFGGVEFYVEHSDITLTTPVNYMSWRGTMRVDGATTTAALSVLANAQMSCTAWGRRLLWTPPHS